MMRRLRMRHLLSGIIMGLISCPALAQDDSPAEATTPISENSQELADLKAKKKPAYQVSCRASGEIKAAPIVSELPPPNPKQLAVLAMLEEEAKAFEDEAKDFQGRLTTIVRHHYEERRRRVLSAIDREIDYQKTNLNDARDEAIRRLESFIARYSGENADPQATPDAMLRLAALYEERGRADFDADLLEELKPAIGLYRDIIVQYPGYEELAATLYYLGHALTDSGRLPEAQHAFRALVCANRYQVTAVAPDSNEIVVQPLVQDHDDRFWTDWYNRNPLPLDERGARPNLNTLGVAEEE